MKYIFAGTYFEALRYAQSNKLGQREWRYLEDARALRGTDNPDVVCVGSYERRKDIDEIFRAIVSRKHGGKRA